MSVYLLDVNVLLALSWSKHTAHTVAQRWFGRNAARGWATCPFVQAGFVRILSNPAFSVHAVSPKEALQALEITTEHPGHQFWPDELGVAEALADSRLFGHQQVTDAYLLALAIHHKGKLATLDQRVGEMLVDRLSERHIVEHIR
jgi:uncharacterized protein